MAQPFARGSRVCPEIFLLPPINRSAEGTGSGGPGTQPFAGGTGVSPENILTSPFRVASATRATSHEWISDKE
jgi:hypothetical protein